MPRVPAPLKCHGGKWYLADRIIKLFPPRDSYTTYVEPYFGGGSVLLRHDPAGKSEIVNDLNYNLTCFWRTLASPAAFQEMYRRLGGTPFSEVEYGEAQAILDRPNGGTGGAAQGPDMMTRAWAFFVVARQSMSGRGDCFAPASTARTRGGRNEQANSWWGAIDKLPAVAQRVEGLMIHHGKAVRIVKKYDKPGVLIYLDPPYLVTDVDGTKVRESGDVYDHEMTLEEHRELLEVLVGLKHARVLLSGYPSKLYDSYLTGWRKTVFRIDNKASKKAAKDIKDEVVWSNY